MASSNITLTYFDGMGRAELSRLIMAAASIPYKDKRLTQAQFLKIKSETPFGSLPILECDGIVLAQSISVARYLAKRGGIAGRNELEQAMADMVVDHVADAHGKMYGMVFGPESDKKRLSNDFFDSVMPKFLKSSEDLLKKRGGKFFVGGQLTWADIAMANFYDYITSTESFNKFEGQAKRSTYKKDYPALEELKNRVYDQHGIRRWLLSRPKSGM